MSWETEGVEFDLPINSEGLFVISRGSLSSGVVRVHQSPDVKDVKVSVVAHYHKKEVLSSARVCLVHPDNAGDGVVILVSRHHDIRLFFLFIKLVSDPIPINPTQAEE